jgi:hypothetical protein
LQISEYRKVVSNEIVASNALFAHNFKNIEHLDRYINRMWNNWAELTLNLSIKQFDERSITPTTPNQGGSPSNFYNHLTRINANSPSPRESSSPSFASPRYADENFSPVVFNSSRRISNPLRSPHAYPNSTNIAEALPPLRPRDQQFPISFPVSSPPGFSPNAGLVRRHTSNTGSFFMSPKDLNSDQVAAENLPLRPQPGFNRESI